jgi:hypothetical protein
MALFYEVRRAHLVLRMVTHHPRKNVDKEIKSYSSVPTNKVHSQLFLQGCVAVRKTGMSNSLPCNRLGGGF